jgi:hypothetical protein
MSVISSVVPRLRGYSGTDNRPKPYRTEMPNGFRVDT